jgi:glutamyl-tRNA synthetase
MSAVKLRFAPSPTGYLHIGGARTALFNWLYARHHRGSFILRIEDTDAARSTAESIQAILDSLSWLGLNWDEGPYYQSQRQQIYNQHIEKLLEEGRAYPCYCTPQELEQMRAQALKEGRKPKYDGRCRRLAAGRAGRPAAIRFKTPLAGQTVVDDLVKGRVVFDNAELDDLIIRRTDGSPTYNLAVVVDDATLGISHIIRGDDHLNNTPRQILLYRALGYEPPRFAHLPLILGPDKARLSKRHGATSVTAYRDAGYLPQAMVNYLARLGWSYGDEEIFSLEELVDKFSLDRVNKAAAIFDEQKLLWLNAHYIKTEPTANLARLLAPLLENKGYTVDDLDWLAEAVKTLQPRSRTLEEMAKAAEFYLKPRIEYDPQLVDKFFTPEKGDIFKLLKDRLSLLSRFDEQSIMGVFDELMAQRGLKLKDIAQPLRVALTGSKVSPGIYETMAVLGKDKVLARIEAARRCIKTQGTDNK